MFVTPYIVYNIVIMNSNQGHHAIVILFGKINEQANLRFVHLLCINV